MLRSVAILVLVALPACASAQSDSSAPPRHSACWRGKPEPQCRRFWITEVSGEYSYATTETHYQYANSVNAYSRPDVSSQVLMTLGPMFNTNPTRALGATISWGYVNDGARLALEARRRNWTSQSSGFDVSAGLLRIDVPPLPDQFYHSAYGVTAGAYGVSSDLVHINAHADVLLTGGRVRAGGTVGRGIRKLRRGWSHCPRRCAGRGSTHRNRSRGRRRLLTR
jgi:hypothetical protein